jgi:hypothetical protein
VEVLHVDVSVALGLLLHPQQQTFLGGELIFGNVLDLELVDETPDLRAGSEDETKIKIIDPLAL